MSTLLLPNFWRFVVTLAAQVLVFQQLGGLFGSYFNVFIYPIFILMLPLALPTVSTVVLGFVIGLALDLMVGTPGVHASAGTFSGFVRGLVIAFFEPKGGFSGKEVVIGPEYFGTQTFLQIAGLFYFAHLFWYFSAEQFTLVYFLTILLKTIAAWMLSMIFVVIYGTLFNPKR
jgi:hypothetical protein